MASVSHMEASSSVLRLLEEQQVCNAIYLLKALKILTTKLTGIIHMQREKQAALDTMLKLERELASKQKLQLEIEQLRGQLKVMECMGGENDKAVKKKIEEMEEDLKEKVDYKVLDLNYNRTNFIIVLIEMQNQFIQI